MLGSIGTCAAFQRRRTSSNSTEDQKETIYDNSYDRQPFFNFALLCQTRSKYFRATEQSTGRVQVKKMSGVIHNQFIFDTFVL